MKSRQDAELNQSYVGSAEGEHGKEDDGQFGFWHFGTNGSQDGHDGSRLKTQTSQQLRDPWRQLVTSEPLKA